MNDKEQITLEDCLAEIKNALNYWFPTSFDGAEEAELNARHVRLFDFKERLENQLEEDHP